MHQGIGNEDFLSYHISFQNIFLKDLKFLRVGRSLLLNWFYLKSNMISPRTCGVWAALFMSFIRSFKEIRIMLTFKFFLKEVHAFQCLLKSHVINMAIKLLIKMKHKLISFTKLWKILDTKLMKIYHL